MNKRKIGVLVSGRGSNLQALMDEIAAGTLNVEITVVISDKKDAFALERAAKAGIKTVAVERKECASKEEFENKITAALEDAGVELVVLAGFMRILSPLFVGHWHHKIVNIHPALLPSFPGLDGQGQALNYGVKIAGCTVHFVDEGTDSGPIDTLADRILEQEHKALPEAVRLWSEGRLQIEGRHVKVLPAER